MKKILLHLLVWTTLIMCGISCTERPTKSEPVKIAFMADVHLHDVYGHFSDVDYKGILNPETGKYNLIRSMGAQLHSTRLFNENYFAFRSALDDAAKKGIPYVVLPGDFSDDGQPVNVRAVKEILEEYTQKHGITFFAITGNHDPVRPFAMPAGKSDFLGEGGKEQAIFSQLEIAPKGDENELPPIITQDIATMGYAGILEELKDFGFFPKEDYLYWETPFSDFKPETYSYERAMELATLKNRTYSLPPYGIQIPDVSYLVEPVDGLWLLALDGNVYVPKSGAAQNPNDPKNYGSASVGYNQVLTHKKHLLPWAQKVASMAKENGKILIAFSHYPMIEFNDDASPGTGTIFWRGSLSTTQGPERGNSPNVCRCRIRIHFGGHMHINDTGISTTDKGNTLVNVQVPSLAAYCPAYKIATIRSSTQIEVETIKLDNVPDFKELFSLYRMEHDYLKTNPDNQDLWNLEILDATTFWNFTEWHLRELVRLRLLNDWPPEVREAFLPLNGAELLTLANADSFSVLEDKKAWFQMQHDVKASSDIPENSWQQLQKWTGYDLVLDFYKIRGADELALEDVGESRLNQYLLVLEAFSKGKDKGPIAGIKEFAKIFKKMLDGAPSDHFLVDLDKGGVVRITK